MSEQDSQPTANGNPEDPDTGSTMPGLTGTERQIAWAETVRHDLMDRLSWDSVDPETASALRDEAALHTEAQWWIEHRASTDTALADDYMARELDGQVAYDGIPAVLGGGRGNVRVEKTVDGRTSEIYQTNGVGGFRVSSVTDDCRRNFHTTSIVAAVETARDFVENGVVRGEVQETQSDVVRSAEERRRLRRARMRRE